MEAFLLVYFVWSSRLLLPSVTSFTYLSHSRFWGGLVVLSSFWGGCNWTDHLFTQVTQTKFEYVLQFISTETDV
jgi:hypothetical protein